MTDQKVLTPKEAQEMLNNFNTTFSEFSVDTANYAQKANAIIELSRKINSAIIPKDIADEYRSTLEQIRALSTFR